MSDDGRRITAAFFRKLSNLEGIEGDDAAGVALRTSGRVAGLIARLIETFGEETAEELLERLLEQPPERVDLTALDEALARWRARQAP
jgi:inactivated superfamily I helicase